MSIYESRSNWLKTILVLQKFFVGGVHESSNYWDLKDFDRSSYANSWWGHSKKGSLFPFLQRGFNNQGKWRAQLWAKWRIDVELQTYHIYTRKML